MICARVPFRTTGKHCQKSPAIKTKLVRFKMSVKGALPANTTVIPPNQRGSFRRSFNVQLSASKQWRCCAGASSQMINEVLLNRAASSLWAGIGHMLSEWISIGILNLECEVRPPSRRIAVMPEDATERAIAPEARILARSKFLINVLLVPTSPRTINEKQRTFLLRLNNRYHRV